jgi:DNA helicase-2/ATP-dependent DNA helicase PcrA
MRSKSTTTALDVVGEIEWAKARMIAAGEYPGRAAAAHRSISTPAETVAEIFARYEDEKLKRRMVDFDDLLRLATRDLEADPQFAAARRWRFRHLFVDEFQDVNPLQFRLLQSWAGPEVDLCVVGDPNQAIYAWNGADSGYLNDFEQYYPGAVTVELTDNYRSTPQILGLANTILLRTSATRFDLVPHRSDGPIPSVSRYDTELEEARSIARSVRDGHKPGSVWSDQAVLVRTNAQLAVFEEAFHAAKIPFRSRGGGRLLDQPEIKEAIAGMRRSRAALNVQLADLEATLNLGDAELDDLEPIDAIGESDATASGFPASGSTASEFPASVTAAEATSSSSAAATPGSAVRGRIAPAGPSRDRAANLGELVRLGREFLDLGGDTSVGAFTGWLVSALSSEGGSVSADAVDLATFHAAKGLEWDRVFIAGVEEGLVPIHYAKTEEAEAEEVRLCYVAFTRARRELHLSWAARRTFGTKELRRKPSPHLDTVELAITMMRESGSTANLTEAIRAERSAIRSRQGEQRSRRAGKPGGAGAAANAMLDAEGQAVLTSLKKWRLDASRAANVPAFVIFNDATLIELAAKRPTNKSGLLAIPGIGAVKAERYSEELLALLTQ